MRPFLNDSIILSVSDMGTVIAWEAQTGEALFLLAGDDSMGRIVEEAQFHLVNRLDTNPTMGLFATACSDYTVRVWR